MLTKRHLNPYFMRLFYYMKNIGGAFFVSFFVFMGLIPILNYLEYTITGVSLALYFNISQHAQQLMPFFSVWHVLFVLRESVEAEGYEWFYMKQQGIKLSDVLGILSINFMLITGLFIFYNHLFDSAVFYTSSGSIHINMWWEYVRILSICFLFLGITYGVTNLFKSITPTILLLLIYTVASMVFYADFPLFFFKYEVISWELLLDHYLVLVLAGGAFFFVGWRASKKYY